jgi:tRNA pseudouridine55 synthase
MRKRNGRNVHGVLLLDKAIGASSNQVLQQVKRLYQARKAGHTGSLDPLATGMLPICFGEATKVSAYLLNADKHYRVTGQLGIATETGDSEGQISKRCELPHLDEQTLTQVLEQFRGEIKQVPPMYSALKHQGKRLYEIARAGDVVAREPRQVVISELRLIECSGDLLTLDVSCSKGTYIRSLIEDIGEALGSCAHVVSLRRTGVAPFVSANMVTYDHLQRVAANDPSGLMDFLAPVDSVLQHWPAVHLDSKQSQSITQGQSLSWPVSDVLNWCRIYQERDFIGIGQVERGRLHPRRMMQQQTA